MIATGIGLVSFYFGYPFLTSAHDHFHVPVIGDLELASAMIFDVGVLLVVVGITMVILTSLGSLSAANRKAAAAAAKSKKPAREMR